MKLQENEHSELVEFVREGAYNTVGQLFTEAVENNKCIQLDESESMTLLEEIDALEERLAEMRSVFLIHEGVGDLILGDIKDLITFKELRVFIGATNWKTKDIASYLEHKDRVRQRLVRFIEAEMINSIKLSDVRDSIMLTARGDQQVDQHGNRYPSPYAQAVIYIDDKRYKSFLNSVSAANKDTVWTKENLMRNYRNAYNNEHEPMVHFFFQKSVTSKKEVIERLNAFFLRLEEVAKILAAKDNAGGEGNLGGFIKGFSSLIHIQASAIAGVDFFLRSVARITR